jgi:hypothetical protein
MEIDPETKSPELDLLSLEKLRSSPELWPPSFASLSDFIKTPNQGTTIIGNGQNTNSQALSNTNQTSSKWMSDLDKNDIEILNELSSLNTPQLMGKVRDLLEFAYQLGLEECNNFLKMGIQFKLKSLFNLFIFYFQS